MSSKIKSWLRAFRLRTLPLALATILLGNALAYFEMSLEGEHTFSLPILFLAILTTLLLQILSNLANDYGDSQKGADNENRIGPERAIQSGSISPKAMKNGMIVCAILAFLSGISLIWLATADTNRIAFFGFLGLGIAAILAALKYTVGKGAYGYMGLGDVFVFVFFGLVGVIGCYWLQTHEFNTLVLLPASAMGLLSVGVLNLNNMRDIDNDAAVGKRTLVVKMGSENAKKYHYFLLIGAIVLSCIYSFSIFNFYSEWLWLFALPLIVLQVRKVAAIEEPAAFDPLLKQLALTTTLWAVLMSVGLVF